MASTILPQILKKILLENNLITATELEVAMQVSEISKLPLKEVLIEKGYFTPQEFILIEKIAQVQKKEFLLANRYELLGKIGQGGMGHVFKARDIDRDEIVAIKVLDEKLSEDPAFVARFQREVEFSYKLRHPNIVSALDTGKDDNAYYLVMEFVDGLPLSRVLVQEYRLEESEALDVVDQLSQALEYIFQQGFIHRDIKPDNILVLSEGQIKLIDMGLVRSTDNASLTLTGSVIGTPHYLSPEQARGEKDLDIRSDVYSLGATLFHLVTGRTPFMGDNPLEVINHHIHTALDNPQTLNPDLSKRTAGLIQWMMHKNKEKRPQRPLQVHQEIEKIRAKGKSFLFRKKSPQTYQPTKYFAPPRDSAFYPSLVLGKKRALIFIFLLVVLAGVGAYLWGFYLRPQVWGPAVSLKEIEAKEAFQKAQETLRSQKTEEAFFCFQDLFHYHSDTAFFSQREDTIRSSTSQLIQQILSNFETIELGKIMHFGGKIQKSLSGKGYRMIYSGPDSKAFWEDWKGEDIPFPKAIPVSNLTGEMKLLQWKLNYSRFKRIALSMVPRKNSILGISIGSLHLLVRVSSGKVYLWQGQFDLPKDKFDTVGGGTFKIHQRDCSLNPNLEETLSLTFVETSGGEKTLQLKGTLQNSHCNIEGTFKKPVGWGKALPLLIRHTEEVKIRRVEVEGQFDTRWIEDLLKKIVEGWKEFSAK